MREVGYFAVPVRRTGGYYTAQDRLAICRPYDRVMMLDNWPDRWRWGRVVAVGIDGTLSIEPTGEWQKGHPHLTMTGWVHE